MKNKRFCTASCLLATILAVSLSSIFFFSCAVDTSEKKREEPEDVYLSKIEIMEMPTKLVYEYGESIDITGLKVKAVYTDGTARDKGIVDKVKISPEVFTKAGDKIPVTVTYTEGEITKTATFTVTVKQGFGFTVSIADNDDISIESTPATSSVTLKAVVPSGITNPTYSWTCDEENISTSISGNTTNSCEIDKTKIKNVCIVTLEVTSADAVYKKYITLNK